MQSFVLAFAMALAAGNVLAEEMPVLEPEAVPPIPAPGEPMTPVAPLDGPWPAAPAGSSVADAGSSLALPPIPSPLAVAPPLGVPPIPAPGEPMTPLAPLDGPWPASPSGSAKAGSAMAEAELPPIPAPQSAELPSLPSAPLAEVRPAFDPAGTVHIVEKGDTLWDISDLYLGTPWIWPSVWSDNEEIENPHLILPGDKIWVSATEMRKISDEEAALLAGDSVPASLAEDVLAVPVRKRAPESFHYMEMATVGVVTRKELRGYARLVGTLEEQINLSQGDTVFIDLGTEDTAVDDEFVLFRTSEKVYDPSSRRSIGYHSEVVAWIEVVEVHEESARALVRMSYAEFTPGNVYAKPREAAATEVVVGESPEGVEGQIVDLLLDPKYRGGGDVIVLNRGSEHGLAPGSPLEVYRPVSGNWKRTWYGRLPDVAIPHEVVASLLVLTVQPTTSMAYVKRSSTELWYGDRFRTVDGPSVDWPEGGIFALPRQVLRLLARVQDLGDHLPDAPEMPDEVAGWNVPRLSLPSLDGYDPR